jgi:anti-anti-sigma factor
MSSSPKIIQPSGILDSVQASQFRQEVVAALQEGARVIVIDFKGVTFMDSSGLGALVLSLKSVRSAGAQLFLCSINEQIKMLFELTNMDRVFEIFDDRQEFEQKLSGSLAGEEKEKT